MRGVRDPGGSTRDIAVSEGRIVDTPRPGAEEIDGEGAVVLPRLADVHVHLDKTLLGERWFPHRPTDTLEARVRAERELLESDLVAPLPVRAARLLERAVAHGTTLVQSHVDVADTGGVDRVETLLTVAKDYADLVDLALVAFPQAGLLRSREVRGALDAALTLGAEAVGGLDPAAFDGDREAHLDAVFALAQRHGTMRAIAARAGALGFEGRCALSHGYALAQVDDAELGVTATAMAEAGVSLVTSVPADGRLPPLRRLRELGVNVVVASDNVRDCWSPFGDADQVARAALAAYCSNWRHDAELAEALHLVTANPAAAVGRPQALLRVGDLADFTLLRAENLSDALVTAPKERLVVRAGCVVARDGQLVEVGARRPVDGRDNRRTELSEA